MVYVHEEPLLRLDCWLPQRHGIRMVRAVMKTTNATNATNAIDLVLCEARRDHERIIDAALEMEASKTTE